MMNFIRQNFGKFIMPLAASIIASVAVGFGSSYLTSLMMLDRMSARVDVLEAAVKNERLPERVTHVEKQIERHEKALERDFTRYEATMSDISHKTDDQEKRLTRLETLVGETKSMLAEIRTDVKNLIRNSKQ